jgi:hypothetical protein
LVENIREGVSLNERIIYKYCSKTCSDGLDWLRKGSSARLVLFTLMIPGFPQKQRVLSQMCVNEEDDAQYG